MECKVISFPNKEAFILWQNDLAVKKGLVFDINLLKLAVTNVIESWTYLDLEQSFNCLKNHKGEWTNNLSNQVLEDVFNECLNLNFFTYE